MKSKAIQISRGRAQTGRWIWITMVLALVAAFLLSSQPAQAFVANVAPNVIGMKLKDAVAKVREKKLKVEAIPKKTMFPGEHLKVFKQAPLPGRPFDGMIEILTIYYYDFQPGPGSPMPKASDIKGITPPRPKQAGPTGHMAEGEEPEFRLVLSPYLIGSTLSEARAEAKRQGLFVRVVGYVEPFDQSQVGRVAEQVPSFGMRIRPQATIDVYLYSEVKPRSSTYQKIRKIRKKRAMEAQAKKEAEEKEEKDKEKGIEPKKYKGSGTK